MPTIRSGRPADIAGVLALWAGAATCTGLPSTAHRGLGIARRLVACGARLRERGGVSRVTALVSSDDPVAVAVWEALGYGRNRGISRFVKNLR